MQKVRRMLARGFMRLCLSGERRRMARLVKRSGTLPDNPVEYFNCKKMIRFYEEELSK